MQSVILVRQDLLLMVSLLIHFSNQGRKKPLANEDLDDLFRFEVKFLVCLVIECLPKVREVACSINDK